jgi:hypothetical protein
LFTGIITHIGRVEVVRDGEGSRDLVVAAPGLPLDGLALGASVAHSGVCLTIVEKGDGRFRVQASPETLARTTLGRWREGEPVNLERSLRLGDELGGHLAVALGLDPAHDPVHEPLDGVLVHAALPGRDADRAGQLLAVEGHAPAVLLEHRELAQLHPLEGGEARRAGGALAPPADRTPLLGGPGVLHLRVLGPAERAAHRLRLLLRLRRL